MLAPFVNPTEARKLGHFTSPHPCMLADLGVLAQARLNGGQVRCPCSYHRRSSPGWCGSTRTRSRIELNSVRRASIAAQGGLPCHLNACAVLDWLLHRRSV